MVAAYVGTLTASQETRFWRHVDKAAANGCWEWTGWVKGNGYGEWRPAIGERKLFVHRVAWDLVRGPIEKGHQLDHLCRNRKCVNPAHLEPVTADENKRRGASIPAMNARKTHCVRGHAFTPKNTGRVPSGRRCNACHRDREHRRIAHRREVGIKRGRCLACKRLRIVSAGVCQPCEGGIQR